MKRRLAGRRVFALGALLGVWLATTHPLPAPVTVLPAATPTPPPKPQTTPKSVPKPAPTTSNGHGVPDGKYYMAAKETKGEHGSARQANHFVVHGNTFEWFRTTTYSFNAAGRRAGKYDYNYVVRQSGTISREAKGDLSFDPNLAEIISRSPKQLPDAKTDIDSIKKSLKGRPFRLRYSTGRLSEVGTSSAWALSRE